MNADCAAGNVIKLDKTPGERRGRPWLLKALAARGPRRPCVFRETDLKRAIRGIQAAGQVPGRVVFTKDGFAVELAGLVAGRPVTPGPDTATPANEWDALYEHANAPAA